MKHDKLACRVVMIQFFGWEKVNVLVWILFVVMADICIHNVCNKHIFEKKIVFHNNSPDYNSLFTTFQFVISAVDIIYGFVYYLQLTQVNYKLVCVMILKISARVNPIIS